jgi:hypothetical protein
LIPQSCPWCLRDLPSRGGLVQSRQLSTGAHLVQPSSRPALAASLTAGSVFCRVGVCRGSWVCCRSWIVLERGKDSRAARSRSRRTQRTTRARPVAATFHRRTPRPAVQPSSACRIANCGVRFLPGWCLPQFLGFLQIPDRTGEVRTAAPPDPGTARTFCDVGPRSRPTDAWEAGDRHLEPAAHPATATAEAGEPTHRPGPTS